MKHTIVKLLIGLVLISSLLAGVVFYSIYIAPEKLSIEYQYSTSSNIPSSLDNVKVGWISDIYYGEFMDESRLTSMIDTINQSSCDVLIFGGDLFSTSETYLSNPEQVNVVTKLLTSLNAPLGKFYVLGDHDLYSNETKALVQGILFQSGFEDITNRNLKLFNKANESITLIGLDSTIKGTPNIPQAFESVSDDSYNMVVTHAPDLFTELPKNIAQLALGGHSLGGQINIPIYGPLHGSVGALHYNKGLYIEKNLSIIVSNGLGTTGVDMRMFAPPQLVIVELQRSK